MEADLQAYVAFYLTGKKQPTQVDGIDGLKLRPALFSGYRDLTRLRYDYPLVLIDDPVDERNVESLSGLIDAILDKLAQGADGERIRKNVLRLEQGIRALVSAGRSGLFSELWDKVAAPLSKADKLMADSLARARANLKTDGEVIDCTGNLAFRLLGHAWGMTQMQRAKRFNADISRLILKLSDIIQADFINSDAGKTAENLKHAFGSGPLDNFNFDAMSRILKKVSSRENLPKRRRQRVLDLISTLQSQQFFPATGSKVGAPGSPPYSFAFDTCSDTLKAYRERIPKAIELARAIAMAELEIKGEYSEAKHDALFESFGENGLDTEELAIFPDYLVRINATSLSGPEQSTLTEILSADLPIKIVVQTDDILEKSLIEHSHLTFTLRSKQLARMSMGMGIFVLQAPASSLYQMRQPIQRGLDYAGSALFSIYSGDSPNTAGIAPYLVGAAACESRLFPAFSFNPSAGRDWASRFSLAANPQVSNDWPVHEVIYQDERIQTVADPIPFTLIDFVACDARYSKHFARVPRTRWSACLTPVAVTLAAEGRGQLETVPYLMMVDSENMLQKVIVDEKLIREARRCRTMWNSLQELGGIHNSHAEKLLASERKSWEETASLAGAVLAKADAAPAATATTANATPAVAAESEAERSPDEACIETPRCSSCNECIQLNGKMFAYDGNKQAIIADASAGTYAQLVEAAENCPVAIIHPGKPRNLNEVGLDELLKRAEVFM
jgi:ferredoxin